MYLDEKISREIEVFDHYNGNCELRKYMPQLCRPCGLTTYLFKIHEPALMLTAYLLTNLPSFGMPLFSGFNFILIFFDKKQMCPNSISKKVSALRINSTENQALRGLVLEFEIWRLISFIGEHLHKLTFLKNQGSLHTFPWNKCMYPCKYWMMIRKRTCEILEFDKGRCQ